MKNKLINAYLDPKHRWLLIREGIDNNGRNFSTSLAIPPTTGDRIDIISDEVIHEGYKINADVIIIIIKKGIVEQIYFKN